MVVRLVLWTLADAQTSIAGLRAQLGDGEGGAGAPFRAWISDESGERFGVVDVLASAAAADEPLPETIRALVGKDPEIFEVFDLEASTSLAAQLDRLGLAFGE